MRIGRTFAALLLAALLLAPTTASAVDWDEWKRLIRERPVAVLVSVTPLVLTSPFMAVSWAFSAATGDGEGDDGD